MEFKEAMKIWHRICTGQKDCCIGCPFFDAHSCMEYVFKHIDEAEQALKEWDEKNPFKTNAMKFKEIFGLEINGSITKPGYFYIPKIVKSITNNQPTLSLDEKDQMLTQINNWLEAEYKEEN